MSSALNNCCNLPSTPPSFSLFDRPSGSTASWILEADEVAEAKTLHVRTCLSTIPFEQARACFSFAFCRFNFSPLELSKPVPIKLKNRRTIKSVAQMCYVCSPVLRHRIPLIMPHWQRRAIPRTAATVLKVHYSCVLSTIFLS